MAWTFYLTITNGTDRELEIASSSIEWGTWYRDGADDRGPCSVGPGQTVQALGIRAARGTATGYECHAQWKDRTGPGERSYGAITLTIDVPYSADNASNLTTAGAMRVDGWSNLPESGHDFNRSITVRAGAMGQLVATVDGGEPDPMEVDYANYLLELAARNPDIRDWSAVEQGLKTVEDFNPLEFLPTKISLTERLLVRSEPLPLEKILWPGIGDSVYNNPYSQDLFVDEYFATAIYSVGTNPRNLITLPASSELKVSERVTITSAIKQVLSTSWSLKNSLSAKATDPISGSEVASTLDSEYSVSDVLEESTETVTEKIVEQTFKAPENEDLTIVPWVFSTAVVIYRKDKKGRYGLVAVSEWARTQIYKSYRTPVSL